MINGVRFRCFTVELSPTRWKAKFGRMDVSEARKLRTLKTENSRLKMLLLSPLNVPAKAMTVSLLLE